MKTVPALVPAEHGTTGLSWLTWRPGTTANASIQPSATEVIGSVAREALAVGRQTFPAYGSRTSQHDFAQAQLFALPAPRQFLRTDYRGLVTLVAEWQELRKALGLLKVPHYSTLAYAARRLLPEAEKGGAFITLRSSFSSGPGQPA